MKLNFWQILGIIILIVGIVLIVRKRTATTDVLSPEPVPKTVPTTAP